MRLFAAAAILALSLAPALDCAAEDRTERIEGAKGWKELVYRGDALAEERSFDSRGALLAERSIGSDALPTGSKRYLREEGRLVKVEALDASGALVGSMKYHYDGEGRLVGLSSDGSFGSSAVGMIASEGMPQGSWIESDASTIVLGYDASGRAVLIQNMREGKVVSIEKRSFGEGGALVSVEVENKASGSSIAMAYDDKGRPALRRETPDKGGEIRTQYLYDESGRLVEELGRRGMYSTSVRRSYSKDGSLSRVETSRNGELLLAVEYRENGYVEELYEDGSLFVKASYSGGRKVRDEFYSEGRLQRRREYK